MICGCLFLMRLVIVGVFIYFRFLMFEVLLFWRMCEIRLEVLLFFSVLVSMDLM